MLASRTSKEAIENGNEFMPKFDENGLIPAIALDAETKQPLMLAYMNEESLLETLRLQQAVYFSRSRQTIWHKGATSGEFQKIKAIYTDCDQDALILEVEQLGGGCCHTKRSTCFYRSVQPDGSLKLNEG